ncbi:MAG: capsule assembly Wzi family protein [Gammaproteobacteria bacterium]|nr:capsule assembly Wzi family protein [Gammaproteobacteria bacterium]
MKRPFGNIVLRLMLLLPFCSAGSVAAGPWLEPGNLQLRNDIQLLADAGIIRIPMSTWPLSWGDVLQSMESNSGISAGAGEKQALLRVRRAAKRATALKKVTLRSSAAISADPQTLRNFQDTPRESAEAGIHMEWTGLRLAYSLKLTGVADPKDNRAYRFDGSQAGIVLGNYMLSAGQVNRWWGPGLDGSLILSTNARPIPAIALRRNFSDPFETRWLSWMGPWTFSVVWGQMEKSRFVPNARFFGARINIRPTKNFELGVSRTAQWCGQGRPCDGSTFKDLLLGRDNRGENTDLDREPGNQLAGIDWRWRLPVSYPLAGYGQLIGEDEAGGLPSRMIGQLGLESWTYSSRLGGVVRGHIEIADTAAEFYKKEARFDYAYEHGIYQSGYRYYGRSIGHTMDNDGRMLSVGATLDTDSGDQWRALVQQVDLNRGGTGANSLASSPADLLNLELAHTRNLNLGRLDFGIGIEHLEFRMTNTSETEFRAHLSWQSD